VTLQNRADLAAATYLEQDIRTSNPLALVARVLELAVQHVNRARAALAIRDLVVKGREVHDASRCVSLLQCNLDMEKGGDVARNMDRLYAYLLRRLTDGHLRNDDGAFQEVARHLTELAGAWREVSSRKNEPARESATAAAAAR
jgi:flagellar protein FliS